MRKSKQSERLHRQLEVLKRAFPPTRPMLDGLMPGGMWPVRLPLALFLILGGVFSFLPVLGIWMLPLGLLLLAVDLPILRPPTSAFFIRARRRTEMWRRRIALWRRRSRRR